MLPKLSHPIFDVTIPTTKSIVKCRPMLVKEEKILLMAKQSGEHKDIITSIEQIVNNCIVTPNINVSKFTLIDLEYVFLKIRSMSISNVAKVAYRDNEDGKVNSFEVDLDKVVVKFEDTNNVISLGNGVTIFLKYPSIPFYYDNTFINVYDDEQFNELLKSSIEKIYQGDIAYSLENTSDEEFNEFIDSIPANKYEEIKNFFEKIPTLFYQIEYKNSLGNDRKIVLRTLSDFFWFG